MSGAEHALLFGATGRLIVDRSYAMLRELAPAATEVIDALEESHLGLLEALRTASEIVDRLVATVDQLAEKSSSSAAGPS